MLSRRLLALILNKTPYKPKIVIGADILKRKPALQNFFSTSYPVAAKVFVDKENKFAHDILEASLNKYQVFRLDAFDQIKTKPSIEYQLPELVTNPPSAVNTTPSEVFEAFCNLVQYCRSTNKCISEQCFQEFSQLFCDVSHKFSDEQLAESLRQLSYLPPTDSVKSLNFVEIWNTLDIVCCRRIEKWNTDQLLTFCDIWYALNLARICEFAWEALRKMGRKVRKMRPEQLVHTMFFCNLVRRPVFEMFDFEENLTNCIDSLSLQEIGIMAMGFFKTQTPIRNPELIEKIYHRLIAEVNTVQDITLVSLLKILRYSSKIPQIDTMMKLLDALPPRIADISLLSCLHVALLGSELQTCHEPCLELILHRFKRDLKQARLKDLERLCLVIGVFNYQSPTGVEKELCAQILEYLKTKVDEIIKYPRCFPTCLHFLSIKGYYDMEMISSVLDKRFIRHAYGSNMTLGREAFYLDAFVKINLQNANYNGNQLPDRHRRTMGKLLTHYIPERNSKFKLNVTDRILLEIKETTDCIFRTNTFKHILPHFERPDIVVCYDRKEKRAIQLSPACPEDYSGVILTRQELLGEKLSDDIYTLAIIIAGWNNIVRDKNRHTALFDMKLKQLTLLGHKNIVIYWHEWRELETQRDRQNFMKRKLAKVINL